LEGIQETQFETAQKMREEGFHSEQIIKITGLSEAQLKEHGIL
jgi:predicted transposase/invertase (TIGR01784 family)